MTKNLFYYYKGEFNTINATIEEYNQSDKLITYQNLNRSFKNHLYGVISKNIDQEISLDSISFIRKVDNLSFDVFQLEVEIENTTWIQNIYNHPFEDGILQIKISYIDEKEGKKLLRSLHNSKFTKK